MRIKSYLVMEMTARWVLIGLLVLAVLIPSVAGAAPQADKEDKGKYQDFREKIFSEHKERMMNWVQNCERWLERMQNKINTSNLGEESKLRIQERIRNIETNMEQIRVQISNANNYTELRDTMREVKKLWINMSKEMRLIAYENAISQMDIIIAKLEELADRFESYGLDTTQLRNAINDANFTLSEIKTKIANGEDVAKDLRELKKKIDAAFAEAKKLARDYKPKPSNGIVMANVNGSFELNGTLNALIKGKGNVTVSPESSVSRANGTTVAIVVRGNATVSGEGDFKIIAHGNGTLTMNGTGNYSYKECADQKFQNGSFNETVTINFGCGQV